jgi:hypothetical protein
MYEMVTDFFGTAVYPGEPYLLYLADNTTECIFEGTLKQFVPYVLTTKSLIAKRGTNAVCKCEDNKSMSGMHIKLTFIFSAQRDFCAFTCGCSYTFFVRRMTPVCALDGSRYQIRLSSGLKKHMIPTVQFLTTGKAKKCQY